PANIRFVRPRKVVENTSEVATQRNRSAHSLTQQLDRRWPMKRVALLLLSAALLAYAGPVLANGGEDEVLISFTGFDYQNPNFSSTYLDLGEGYKVVGFVTSSGPLLASYIDFTSFEYTIYIRDLTVNGRFFTFPNLTVTFANNGRGSYYADAFPADGGTAATYGVNPPNATA